MKRFVGIVLALYVFWLNALFTIADEADTYISEEYQEVIIEVAEMYAICPELIMAMVEAESSGNADAHNEKYGCMGLMQVNPKWHETRMEKLGVTDLYDPEQNILVGCDYVAELFEKYGEINNEGEYGGAIERAYAGEWSRYAKKIAKRSEELERWHGK